MPAGFDVWSGDVNGDAATDLLVSAPYNDGPTGVLDGAGSVSVFFGGQDNNRYVAHAGLLLTAGAATKVRVSRALCPVPPFSG